MIVGCVTLALFIIGLTLSLNQQAKSGGVVLGVILSVVSFIAGVSSIKPISDIYKKENADYSVKIAKNETEIAFILEEIKRLVKIDE